VLGELEVYLHAFARRWMEVSGQLHAPAALPLRIHCIGGWVGPRGGLGAVSKRRISNSHWESKPDRPAHKSESNVPLCKEISLWILFPCNTCFILPAEGIPCIRQWYVGIHKIFPWFVYAHICVRACAANMKNILQNKIVSNKIKYYSVASDGVI
jgi:hypothetical protein